MKAYSVSGGHAGALFDQGRRRHENSVRATPGPKPLLSAPRPRTRNLRTAPISATILARARAASPASWAAPSPLAASPVCWSATPPRPQLLWSSRPPSVASPATHLFALTWYTPRHRESSARFLASARPPCAQARGDRIPSGEPAGPGRDQRSPGARPDCGALQRISGAGRRGRDARRLPAPGRRAHGLSGRLRNDAAWRDRARPARHGDQSRHGAPALRSRSAEALGVRSQPLQSASHFCRLLPGSASP